MKDEGRSENSQLTTCMFVSTVQQHAGGFGVDAPHSFDLNIRIYFCILSVFGDSSAALAIGRAIGAQMSCTYTITNDDTPVE